MSELKIYHAPLEGITNEVYRNAFNQCFGHIYKYFTPFFHAGKEWSAKVKRDLNPDRNKGMRLVPQAISNSSEEVLSFEKKIMDWGYDEYNINLGCPSGTVVSKGRGAGMLADPDSLDRFLYEIYSRTNATVSLKTRIGVNDLCEWQDILAVYVKYPIAELIIHPRLRAEQYKGTVHFDAFEEAVDVMEKVPLVFNGDINVLKDVRNIQSRFSGVGTIMIGRGLLRNPGLAKEIITGEQTEIKDIKKFHDMLYCGLTEVFSGEKDTIKHMKELWSYLRESFPDRERDIKRLMKTKEPIEYKAMVKELF